ncbi:hypothetical protein Nepgr_016400 [Nepenthes gracilis]|uniref:Uncharacterized protein n=1 Tax=Nepenthes gracilis TaxID=150966 RepID=A0AAD3SPN8_NEPGR|nr:hypothetical protein Nepgr_016400 [Nepenthes gracilis]
MQPTLGWQLPSLQHYVAKRRFGYVVRSVEKLVHVLMPSSSSWSRGSLWLLVLCHSDVAHLSGMDELRVRSPSPDCPDPTHYAPGLAPSPLLPVSSLGSQNGCFSSRSTVVLSSPYPSASTPAPVASDVTLDGNLSSKAIPTKPKHSQKGHASTDSSMVANDHIPTSNSFAALLESDVDDNAAVSKSVNNRLTEEELLQISPPK